MTYHRRIAVLVISVGLVATSFGGAVASAGATRAVGDRDGAVKVERDGSDGVALVHGRDGLGIDRPAASRDDVKGAARGYVVEHGPAFGLSASSVGPLSVERSATGQVVRGRQHIEGLPVYGGEVVASLDNDQNLLSISAETTEPPAQLAFHTPRLLARKVAVATVADAHQYPRRGLTASAGSRWVYDPALVGEAVVAAGARPVWRFAVTGPGVHDTVLIDAARGGVALRVSEITEISRRVCDRDNQTDWVSVPACTATLAVRSEGTGETGQTEVDAAYTTIGRASDLYASLGRDLGASIGTGPYGAKVLEAWVRWCTTGESCPMDNAFWDGARMVLGEGYAGADDVVAHELTHGVVDRTSQLVYLHQSGAINESLADIMGEIVDQRSQVGDDDSAWLIGEDAPGGAIRSLSSPTLFGQPDRMSSPDYGTGDAAQDSGEVHHNSGIGNKAAFLISQGGTFNGVTVAGVDAGDSNLTKTATLYHEVMVRLTSGAEYDDLARTLASTCAELAAATVAGFTSEDCASVEAAIAATELLEQPVSGAAPEVSNQCPPGQTRTRLFRDGDHVANSWTTSGRGYTTSGDLGSLWTPWPSQFGAPTYTHDGTGSWFGVDPDPHAYGDASVLTLRPTDAIPVPVEGNTYLHFHHAHLLEWYPATETSPARYQDGAQVNIWIRNPDNTTMTLNRAPLDWVNGPDKQINSVNPWTAFGGDSHGWGSSRLELSALGGNTVYPQWRISADGATGFLGWYVDDIEIYNCRDEPPSSVRDVEAVGTTTGANLAWTEPETAGAGITGYRVTRSDGLVTDHPASARSATYATLPATPVTGFEIAPLGSNGEPGPSVSATVTRTKLNTATNRARVKRYRDVLVTAALTSASTGAPVAGKAVTFQRRRIGKTTWSDAFVRSTQSDGNASARFRMDRSYEFRVHFGGSTGWVGSKGPSRKVTVY